MYCSVTIGYKTGFIHQSTGGMILVQVDRYAYAVEVKSFHAAKLAITKHIRKGACYVLFRT